MMSIRSIAASCSPRARTDCRHCATSASKRRTFPTPKRRTGAAAYAVPLARSVHAQRDGRGRADLRASVQLGEPMMGGTVNRVVASRHPQFRAASWCSATPAGRTTRCRTAKVCSRSARWRSRRSRWAGSACPRSPPTSACSISVNRNRAKLWSSPRRPVRSARWSGRSRSSKARASSASPAARTSADTPSRNSASMSVSIATIRSWPSARRRLPARHRRLFRERRRRGVRRGAAAAQHRRARAGVRIHRALQRRGAAARPEPPAAADVDAAAETHPHAGLHHPRPLRRPLRRLSPRHGRVDWRRPREGARRRGRRAWRTRRRRSSVCSRGATSASSWCESPMFDTGWFSGRKRPRPFRHARQKA